MNKAFIFIFITLFLILGIRYVSTKSQNEERNLSIKIEKKKFKEKTYSNLNDLNKCSIEEMRERGITKATAEKIERYRNIIGKIEKFEDLLFIKGIGKKTLEKIEKNFILGEGNFNKININNVDEEILTWLKFDKKDLKKIKDWKAKNKYIYSNLDLIEIIGEERYSKLKDRLVYSNY